jgi:hypothetical protein
VEVLQRSDFQEIVLCIRKEMITNAKNVGRRHTVAVPKLLHVQTVSSGGGSLAGVILIHTQLSILESSKVLSK